jgi:hypothetical protein
MFSVVSRSEWPRRASLQNHASFRFDEAFHHHLPDSIHYRNRDAFLDLTGARAFWKFRTSGSIYLHKEYIFALIVF